ncbi:N(6)-hydroxylysine O-acetyltransferase [Staphylotrichum tortipilum]|uniref:N(6)-hydroxylysine O-acetyltransferase n=1 Tax=Staphylotrichum tortipilum TaxID=2831512 RepID=A0AAN6MP41_9PEZI|nr:N(6)-hydroxylysine O-acetyltransferase [Staphylotrichum longicolle]
MASQVVRLPDGQHITVKPVFAGLFFKSNELSHDNAFPIGWTIVIHAEGAGDGNEGCARTPTLHHDSLFISSISNPSSSDFKPAASPTRQVAMMLWVTLYWYFHQPPPFTGLSTEAAKLTPAAGKPRGEWRVRVKRDGVLQGRNLIPKLERMGLIASANSAVGTALEDNDDMWSDMFVTQQMFWQLPGRLFLFSLQPIGKNARSFPGSPTPSRPGSPAAGEIGAPIHPQLAVAKAGDLPRAPPPTSITSIPSFPIGPFFSASHLPTYYPPPPMQYTITNHIRHPLRPKPPRMGEVFYTRFVPSVKQYLAFRVASISPKPVPYMGPVSPTPPTPSSAVMTMGDSALLEMWHHNPRVSAFWGEYSHAFLASALQSRHSFPVIGLWDGVPFGYFELYWVKEDLLGRYAGSAVDDWDRGCHVLIGEEWARGRVQSWLTSLVHFLFCADYRTMSICLEPRVDNASRFIQHLEHAGFNKEKEIAFPHKQAWFGRLRRECWQGPSL